MMMGARALILLSIIATANANANAAGTSKWLSFDHTNAVSGCGLACVSHGAFKCVGQFDTASACAETCETAAPAACSIWTWSSTSKNCWHRPDGIWDPTPAAYEIVSGCLAEGPGCVLGCGPDCGAGHDNSTITIGAETVGQLGALSPGVTLDWWTHDDPVYGYQWGNASILTLDLANADLRTLARGLAPGLLRLGGSPLDSIVYATTPAAEASCARGKNPKAGGGAKTGWACSQLANARTWPKVNGTGAYGCLTRQRWADIVEFASDVGLKMVFGLNACFGREGANEPMDFSNLQTLLDLTVTLPKEHLANLIGFEFGNEIEHTAGEHFPGGVSWLQWAKDTNTLSGRINATFQNAGLAPLPVVGPDQGFVAEGAQTVLDTVKPGVLRAFTYHQYPQCQPSAAGSPFVLNPACIAAIDGTARAAAALTGAGLDSWAGESAVHTASGGDFGMFMGTFRSSFYYAWQIGGLPADGVPVAVRQALIGGNYGLLNRTTFMPTPDYWIAWTYRALFSAAPPHGLGGQGAPAAVAGAAADAGLHAMAFRGAGGGPCLVVLINLLANEAQTVDVQGVAAAAGGNAATTMNTRRVEWHFTGSGGAGADATQVDVNGRALAFAQGASLPVLADLGRKAADVGAPVALAPASIGFFLFS